MINLLKQELTYIYEATVSSKDTNVMNDSLYYS